MLQSKVAIVTGAGTGIGRACARLLHAAGARVALLGRREDLLEESRRELGGDAETTLAHAVDVRDREGVVRAVATSRRSGAGSTSSSTTRGRTRRGAAWRPSTPTIGTRSST
jgi:NADP-dependent 3-hydroxy acid dehydrogenase YdfG